MFFCSCGGGGGGGALALPFDIETNILINRFISSFIWRDVLASQERLR